MTIAEVFGYRDLTESAKDSEKEKLYAKERPHFPTLYLL